MGGITGILFDLGNTLLDFGPVDTLELFRDGARQAYAYVQALGQPVPGFARFHRRQLWALRWRYLLSRLTQREFNSLDVLRRISRQLGQDLSEGQLEELTWRWYEPLSRCASVEDGLADMLRGFRGRGIRLGLVSNTFVPGEVLDRHLRQVGLLEHLPCRVYSCDVRYRKPHRRIFRIALNRLGTSAGQTLFVGDSLRADVAGARRAGMITVLKDPTGARLPLGARPHHRVAALRELPGIVQQHRGT